MASSSENLQLNVRLKKTFFEILCYKDDRNKAAKKVKEGWSTKLSKLIWNQFRIKCVWRFVRARPRATDILINGTCKDCAAEIKVVYKMANRTLSGNITGYNSTVKHVSKRRLLPAETKRIAEMLKGSSTFEVRAKLADETMNDDDPEPPHLVRPNAIRKIKCKQSKSLHTDPVRALLIMKEKHFRNEITAIGLSPFYVFYAKNSQKKWHNSEFKRKRCVISIDATGLGLRKLGQASEKYMFLYVICSHGKYQLVKSQLLFRYCINHGQGLLNC